MSTEPFAKGVISPNSITYLSEFNCSQKRTHYDSKEYKHNSPALGKADARKSTLFFFFFNNIYLVTTLLLTILTFT